MKSCIGILALLGSFISKIVMAATTTGTGHISAQIVNPVTINETQSLNFGTITNDPGIMGVTPTGFRYSYGDNLVNDSNNPTRGEFVIMGSANQAVTVTVPVSGVTITNGNGGNISVDIYTDAGPGTQSRILDDSGSLTIYVAGELNPQNMPAGNYSGTYTITVNY